MPRPTTTIFFRCEGSLGYFSVSLSSLLCPPAGSRLIAMPGDDVAHDILWDRVLTAVVRRVKPDLQVEDMLWNGRVSKPWSFQVVTQH